MTADRDGTSLDLRIYSNSARTTLVDTLSVTIASGRTYRYVFAVVSHDYNDNDTISFDVKDLDLKEAAGGVPTHMDYYRRRRCA